MKETLENISVDTSEKEEDDDSSSESGEDQSSGILIRRGSEQA